MKRILIVVMLFVALLVPANTAKAEGFAITDFSARGVGLAGGMVGRADDPSAIAYNPAGITQLPGFQVMVGGSVLSPTGTIAARNAAGEERAATTVDNLYPAPHMYATYQATDFLWLGLGIFPRFGLGIEYDNDWFGRFNLTEVSLETLSINPTIAFKFTDKMSFAFGAEIMTASMDMDKDTNLGPLVGTNRQNLQGDGTAFGFNAALHYVFDEQWRAGLSYRHHVNARVKGDSTWQRQINSPLMPIMLNSSLYGTLKLPAVVSFGLNYAPTPLWDFEVGFVHTMWSAYEDLNINLNGPAGWLMESPKEWNDTWLFNISTEYQALDWLALRLGYSYETSPLEAQYVDYMMPSEGRHRFSTGLGFSWENWVLDLAYSYIYVREVSYSKSITSGVGPGGMIPQEFIAVRGFDGETHVGTVSLTYKF